MNNLSKTLFIIFVIISIIFAISIFYFYTMTIRTNSVVDSFDLLVDDCKNASNFYKDHNIELDEKFIENSNNDI